MMKLTKNIWMSSLLIALVSVISFSARGASLSEYVPPIQECTDCGGTTTGGGIIGGEGILKPGGDGIITLPDDKVCMTTPTCDALGYNTDISACDSSKPMLKCPKDSSKVYCTSPACAAGDNLYADGTCSKEGIDGIQAIGIVFDPVKRVAWHPISIFTGTTADLSYSWENAKNACAGTIGGVKMNNFRLGTKEELETLFKNIPSNISSVAPNVTTNTWTSSEKDASSAWAYKINYRTAIKESIAMDKSTKNGVFCVKSF